MQDQHNQAQASSMPTEERIDIDAIVEEELIKDASKLQDELKKGLYDDEKARRTLILRQSLIKAKELKIEVNKTDKPDTKLWDGATEKQVNYFSDQAWNARKKAKEAYDNFIKLMTEAWNKPSKEVFNKLEQKLKKQGKSDDEGQS